MFRSHANSERPNQPTHPGSLVRTLTIYIRAVSFGPLPYICTSVQSDSDPYRSLKESFNTIVFIDVLKRPLLDSVCHLAG